MAHISLSPPSNAGTFSPLAKSFNRITADGSVPVINFLIGSHYGSAIGNEMSFDSTGDIGGDTVTTASSKLEIAAFSNDTLAVTKISSFVPFMYFYPGLKIVGHMELQNGVEATTDNSITYTYSDLATADKIKIVFESGTVNSQVLLKEIVGGVETTLATTQMSVTTNEIYFELDFLDEGKTKFYLIDKTAGGSKTRVFNGDISADIAEAKCDCAMGTTSTATRTVKSDFMWIFYPKIFVSYDVELDDRLNGRVRIFDTNNEIAEADWDEVFSSDHKFIGERVIQNGLVRIWFKPTPGMEVYGWNGAAWALTGEVIPKSSQDTLATNLHDVILKKFNNTQCIILAKYGLLTHTINIRRGTPYVRISATSTKFRINTTKERVALSTANNTTDIPDFNQTNTNDTNRGNPLSLSPTANPFTFTNDNDATTGLDRINDNYFAWYDNNLPADTLGFLGFIEKPIGASITATDATTLSHITWDFPNQAVVCVGTLTARTDTEVGGVMSALVIGVDDTYIKYRANEGVWAFNQKMTLRRKR